jgi:alcohol dehydrogenase class IV
MDFEFATAARILFGNGKRKELPALAKNFGRRALIVTGSRPDPALLLAANLEPAEVSAVVFSVRGEPSVAQVIEGAARARNEQCDMVLALGGGSALDAGKAIAALMTNPGDLTDYLEVIGHGQPITRPAAPCITIPTTAGTGAEVTRNAVLTSPEHRFKVSLRSPLMLPRVALVDPELTLGLPRHLTASTGLDALTQLIEPYVSHRANPLADGFCREGLRRVARSLRTAYNDGGNRPAREDMALAGLLSGLSLANAALGAVHGFAAPLGGMYSAPHGELCAAVLPHAMAVNIRALRQRQPGGEGLHRFAEVAQVLTARRDAQPEDGVAWVRELCAEMAIRPLAAHGVREADFGELIDKASKASSMKGNPLPLTAEELRDVLEGAM